MFEMREHQSDALEAITNSTVSKGRVVIPTGGGKTMVEAYALRDIINQDLKNIHLVLAPRITLVNQLINEYRHFIGQNYLAVAFHSARMEPDYTKIRWSETSTTNPNVVQEEYARAQRMGKDLVIFSTYASCHKLIGIEFDSLIADESQYCVSENYFNAVDMIQADKKLFFTATEKHTASESGRGLNNTTAFGDVLYQVAPQTLIDKGYIVPPRLHVMSGEAKSESYTVIDECIQIAKKQAELTASMPVTKILFAMKGTEDVKNITENMNVVKAAMPGFRVFTIVSNTKYGAQVDGQKIPRGNFLKELRECDNALIFHYDILSEGIDIDGITGVAILRNMNHAKLLQTIGRSVRVYKANPSKKTQAWVSVVTINGNDETADNLARTIKTIREGGFEVNIESVEFTDNDGFGIADPDSIDPVVGPTDKKRGNATLERVLHEIEMSDYWTNFNSMSLEEQPYGVDI
jgi:superfamily II DNA or RNA helicase